MGEPLPDSRLCVHSACRTATAVTGPAFEALADPFARVRAVHCGTCRAHFPLDEFAWADTGEGLRAARARWAGQTPGWARWVYGRYGWLVLIAVSAALGTAVGWAADDPADVVADRWRWAGGLCGAGAGLAVARVLRWYIRLRYFGHPTFCQVR